MEGADPVTQQSQAERRKRYRGHAEGSGYHMDQELEGRHAIACMGTSLHG
jgi:hypothetical protein